MKKIKYILLFSAIIWACGGDNEGDDIPIPNPENKAPSVPLLLFPTNNLLCTDNVLNFNWNPSTDPDGDALTYQIQVSKDNYFGSIAYTFIISTTEKSITLEKGVPYYWRVKAIDAKNLASSFSSIYSFYTEGKGDINYLPFSPLLVAPELNSVQTETTILLKWTGNDVDNDPLVFDVFFGKANPPNVKISENQNTNTLSVAVELSTNYYWKVIVKDDKGGETIGQIWNFKTE